MLPQFGDYELLAEIARGGMGVVYRAQQRSLNRQVAVKMILAGQLATPESLQRFRLEAEAAARLHHPGIVPIYEIGEHETQHFYSMELIDGVSLAECLHEFVVDAGASLADQHQQELCIAELMSRVARALEFAHQHGVLHRDMKPSNILIDQNGQPHLTDFGLAKLTGREAGGLTLTQAVLGTPGYLAPEQASGDEDITTAADVYGLGATLYDLLTGRPPFVGTSALDTMWMTLNQPPAPPRRINPAVHRDLETIALHCLEKQPAQRYPSAAAVAEDLERFLRGEPITARPVSTWEHAWRWCLRNRRLSSLAVSLVLTVLVGSVVAFWQWNRAEQSNVQLRESVEHLRWDSIVELLHAGQASRALAQTAALLRADSKNWKAAMFAMSLIEQNRFPLPIAPPIRHPDGTELAVARLSPDGLRIVTASYDGTARLWDPQTSAQLVPPLEHGAPVLWAEFSPDSRRLATCSGNRIHLWDPATGTALGAPLEHVEPVEKFHFSGDGRHLLSRTQRTVSVYDVSVFDAGARLRQGPLQHAGRIVAAKFLQAGKFFFTAQQAGEDSLLQVWDTETGERRVALKTGPFAHADIDNNLRWAATNQDNRATIWDVATGEPHREINEPALTFKVAFNPRGDHLATLGFDWVRIWNSATGVAVTPELPHYYILNGAAFLDQGERILTWGDDSLAQIWDAATGAPFVEPMRHKHRIVQAEVGRIGGKEVFLTTMSHLKSRNAETRTGAAQVWRIHEKRQPVPRMTDINGRGLDGVHVSHNGKLLAIGNNQQQVLVSDLATGELVCPPLAVNGGAWGIFFSLDDSRVITTTSRGQVALWSLPGGELLSEPIELGTTIQPAELTRDGRRLATGSVDGLVRLWDADTGQVLHEMPHPPEINAVGFSSDGRLLASGGEDRTVRLWDVATGALRHELRGHKNEVTQVGISPDGRRVVSSSHDWTARIWDVASGQQLHELPHQGEVVDMAISPDGKYVATGARDRTAMIWDLETGQPHTRSLSHEQAVRNVRFSPDGKRLLSLDFRGLNIWDVASGHPLTVHLPQMVETGMGFQSTPIGPSFTPDGNSVISASSSPHALLFRVAVPPADIPRWFPEFLEAVAGQRVKSGTDLLVVVAPEQFLELRQQLASSTDTDYYTRWVKQWLLEW